jgi:hypothetical protein
MWPIHGSTVPMTVATENQRGRGQHPRMGGDPLGGKEVLFLVCLTGNKVGVLHKPALM